MKDVSFPQHFIALLQSRYTDQHYATFYVGTTNFSKYKEMRGNAICTPIQLAHRANNDIFLKVKNFA